MELQSMESSTMIRKYWHMRVKNLTEFAGLQVKLQIKLFNNNKLDQGLSKLQAIKQYKT